jgi:hypothetical protein
MMAAPIPFAYDRRATLFRAKSRGKRRRGASVAGVHVTQIGLGHFRLL